MMKAFAALLLPAGLLFSPVAAADDIGYVVNVTLGPGAHFAGADQALAYGYGI